MTMVRRLGAMAALALAFFATAAGSPAKAEAPDPNIVPGGWELDFDYSAVKIIALRARLDEAPTYYWYMKYKATNKTGADRLFVPEIWLLTDAGDMVRANNKDVPNAVFTKIKKLGKNPLLQNPATVVGKLLQGEDNARESVAIWRVPKHNVNMLRVFVGGLSGETHRMFFVEDAGDTPLVKGTYVPQKDLDAANEVIREHNDRVKNAGAGETKTPAQAKEQPVLMRKTLLLEYEHPGDASHAREKPYVFKRKKWVIR